MLNFGAAFLASFLVTYLSMPVFRALAFKFNILDMPGERKIHQQPTPRIGGVAIYLGLIAGAFLYSRAFFFSNISIFVAGSIIMILGLIDDLKGLSASTRIFFQLVSSLIIINSGMRIEFFPNTWWGNTLEVTMTFVWLVGLANAYNYLDGIDGLAAGSAVINLFSFAVILVATGQSYFGVFVAILIGSCLGFLPHNFCKKKVFLGDSGSTFLGFMLAVISVAGAWAEDNFVKVTIPTIILGVPIFDMIFTTIMRIKDKKVKTVMEWLEYCGRDHFHHYLVDLGLRHIGSVLLIYCVTVFLGLSAIMLSNNTAFDAVLTLLQVVIIFVVISLLIISGRRKKP